MSVDMTETAGAASALLSDALGDWWNDDRRNWCAYCGIAMRRRGVTGKPTPPQKKTKDHVIPKAHNGGLVTIPSCRECNQAKDKKSLPEFLLSEYFAEKRTRKHRNQWPVANLWMVAALAAMRRAREG